ncbi:MAG: TlpA family protein disulfide reductase [Bacilli bacterium]
MAKDKKKKIENVEEIEEVIETANNEEIEEYNEKEVTIMDMLNRIVVCLIIIAIILAINTIVLVCKSDSSVKSESTTTTENSDDSGLKTDEGGSGFTCIDGYDSSMFEKVDLDGVLDLFDSKGISVLYIGRCDCGACATFLPTLQKAQEEYGFTTQYFDINYLDSKSDAFEKVQKKLTKKYEMVGQDGSTQTETFGYWIGYTPMTVIIKDGKQVDGEIGAIDYDTLAKMLENSGLSK